MHKSCWVRLEGFFNPIQVCQVEKFSTQTNPYGLGWLMDCVRFFFFPFFSFGKMLDISFLINSWSFVNYLITFSINYFNSHNMLKVYFKFSNSSKLILKHQNNSN